MLLSIIVPTKNEELNIKELLVGIWNILIPYAPELKYEVLVVDDGNDATANIARIQKARVIHGQRKGLGQAILDGIAQANGDIILVIDADNSHDPKYIPELIRPIMECGYDMTIGSRYVKGGGTLNWSFKRRLISRFASLLAYPVTWLQDNTSGFFAFRKSILDGVKLKAHSWKIMLEILVWANPTAVMEVPITFRDRKAGQSKFNSKQIKAYLFHVARLALFKYKTFIKFGLIGLIGALIHFTILYTLTDIAGIWYILSAVAAIVLTSTFNYFMNHKFTFKDRRISNHLLGWAKYQALSGITDGAYLGLLALFTEVFGLWYLASALIAVLMIYPVKFIVASSLIWSKRINVNDPDYEWNAFYKGSLIQKWWKRKIANIIWKWIPESDSILDYGCGSSPLSVRYGGKAVCCDTDLKKLEFMRAKCPRVNYVDGTLAQLERQYDHALCIEVIEHLESPDYLMDYLSSVVKGNGMLVIATPDYGRWWWYLAEIFTPYKEAHVKKYTRESLERLCMRYGFIPLKHEYVAGCDLCEMFVRQ
jgi:dolichol-phosphate mannosyltransferase